MNGDGGRNIGVGFNKLGASTMRIKVDSNQKKRIYYLMETQQEENKKQQ